MRVVTITLLVLLGLVHAELWFGRGGMGRVMDLNRQLAQQQQSNTEQREHNARLVAEVRDLQEGLEMVEEKARGELGMIKPDEILVQYTLQQQAAQQQQPPQPNAH
jgi:cell division protein FtsB